MTLLLGIGLGFGIPWWTKNVLETSHLSMEIDSIRREIPETFKVDLNDYPELRVLKQYDDDYLSSEYAFIGRNNTREKTKDRTIPFKRLQELYNAAQYEFNNPPEGIRSAEADIKSIHELIDPNEQNLDKLRSIDRKYYYDRFDFYDGDSLENNVTVGRQISILRDRLQIKAKNKTEPEPSLASIPTTNSMPGTPTDNTNPPVRSLSYKITTDDDLKPENNRGGLDRNDIEAFKSIRVRVEKNREKVLVAFKDKQSELQTGLAGAKKKLDELTAKFSKEKSLFSITAVLVNSGSSTVSIRRPVVLRVYIGTGNYIDLNLFLDNYKIESEVLAHGTRVVTFVSDEISNFPKEDQALINTYWGQSVGSILFVEDILGRIHPSNNDIAFSEGLYQKQIRDRLIAEASKGKYPRRN